MKKKKKKFVGEKNSRLTRKTDGRRHRRGKNKKAGRDTTGEKGKSAIFGITNKGGGMSGLVWVYRPSGKDLLKKKE